MFPTTQKDYPYASKRSVVYAKNGMVAAAQPLAAQAGLDILKQGGNAVDAAIATAACLTVVEPTSNGIGGDAFAIVWMNQQIHGLNASGYSPNLLTIKALQEKGLTEIPRFGFTPVTVPGIPSAWAALAKRFGTLPLSTLLASAIAYARDGFPVSPVVASNWANAASIYASRLKSPEFAEWFRVFTRNGIPPKEGDIWTLPDHAKTLERIANDDADCFYRGSLASEIDAFSQRYGGYLRKEDLASFHPDWVEPRSIEYRGYHVWELPPNGHGFIALQALNIIKGFPIGAPFSDETIHHQIESLKLAFADGLAYLSDLKTMPFSPEHLLSDSYATARRALISDVARLPQAGKPYESGTVYLATADKDGTMVSYIQSNYMGFGSGLVVPNTGIALHNRGHNFTLDPTHPNCLGPRKKPYHTIIPGFLTKDGHAVGPFGVMGGFMQPQGHFQVMMNTIDFHENPQSAIDHPRWQWLEGNKIVVEPSMPQDIVTALMKRGHEIRIEPNLGSFGRAEIIWRDPESKTLCGATESRADGCVAAW